MAVLTGPEIVRLVKLNRTEIAKGNLPPVPSIFIEPFDEKLAGSNSYDIHLSSQLRVYALSSVRRMHPELFSRYHTDAVLPDGIDPRVKSDTVGFDIPDDDGF